MRSEVFVLLVDGRLMPDDLPDDYLAWLGEAELARYRRFVRPERRRQFVVGRVLVRQALGKLLGAEPRSLIVVDVPGGAPMLAEPKRAYFSISHSRHYIACAVSATTKIGLDVELLDPGRDLAALAAQAFDAELCTWLAARPDSTRVRDFYNAWSANEAHIKLGSSPAQTVELSHPHLSVVLCSAQRLDAIPVLQQAGLD